MDKINSFFLELFPSMPKDYNFVWFIIISIIFIWLVFFWGFQFLIDFISMWIDDTKDSIKWEIKRRKEFNKEIEEELKKKKHK